ncbi:MAG: sugar ABC transporter ATP-binding protein [Actinobacteria bacterium]|nr:sugar ABC transporter ATP-binding protein [Actinomycetota bacterium]
MVEFEKVQKIAQNGLLDNNNGTIFEVQSLFKIFPGTIALENVNIKFNNGEVHGIVGKNGAGKSTLVNILSGIIHPSDGKIIFNTNEKEFLFLTPEKAKKEGIIIVTQKPEVIPDFNLVQNLFLPQYKETKIKTIKWKEMFSRAKKVFEKAGFDIDLSRKMSDLTLSEQQIFLILKAFYIDNQNIVLLDEVTNSFSKKEQDFFFKLINEQKKSGKSIIFISHRIDEVLSICDRITVMRDGKVVSTDKRSTLDKEKICSMIVGKENYDQLYETNTSFSIQKDRKGVRNKQESTILAVEELTKEGFFKEINFSLKMGEILGLAGLVGSGRTEILKAISGIEPAEKGWVVLEGAAKKKFLNSWDAIQSGIVYLTENRDEDGLVNILSVRKNLTLSYLVSLAKDFLIKGTEEENLSKELIHRFEVITASSEEEVQNLSGGNRQKVLFGRVTSTKAKVFLLDEPTKGIDIASKEVILRAIRERLSVSAGVIVTSPGIDDLLSVCDRILILFEGKITCEFKREEFNELEIYQSVQGLTTRKRKD